MSRAARFRDFAANDDFMVRSDPGIVEAHAQRIRQGIDLETRFHDRGLRAGSNEVRRSPVTENEPERIDENGFSGTGLSSEKVQPRFEIHFEPLDHGDVLDTDPPQHGGMVYQEFE